MSNFRDELDTLTEAYQQVNERMKDAKGDKPEEKDYKRINDIIAKSSGDEAKMIQLVKAMAKKINKPDKAARRAAAAEFLLPKNIAKQAGGIFRGAR